MSLVSLIDQQEYARCQTDVKAILKDNITSLRPSLNVVEPNTVQIPQLGPANIFGDYI